MIHLETKSVNRIIDSIGEISAAVCSAQINGMNTNLTAIELILKNTIRLLDFIRRI